MVIVRESPRAKISPDKAASQWPPKSPFQALLSSPSGRKKWQDYHNSREEVRSPSPSPMRKPMSSHKSLQSLGMSDDEGGDDEDEETLQLQLQQIQTKLKLKELQKRKNDGQESGSRTVPRARSASPRKATRPTSSHSALRKPDVEVELSPVRDRFVPKDPVSPARKRLGLSAAAKAEDVSLKRARDGTQIKRASSVRAALDYDTPKPTSFSERLQASKHEAEERQSKHERLEQSRSKGFSSHASNHAEAQARSGRTATRADSDFKRPSSARETQNTPRLSKEPSIARSASTRSLQKAAPQRQAAEVISKPARRLPAQSADSDSDLSIYPTDSSTPSSSYDPISEIHLTKRHISHSVVAREMEDKEIYTLPRLLKEVKSPHYDPPDIEGDYVVFAILASKSSPFDAKSKHRTSDENKPQEDADGPRNKFLVLHLCDLKWEIDCFLFGTGFDQFWKLTPGTLLAILNPAIMPPNTNQHNGRFSLKLSSREDKVMEIGLARDLGYCSSVKKDGEKCGQWIDKRSTDICDFHLDLFVERQRKGRMEVNTMWRGTGGDAGKRVNSQAREAGGFDRGMKKGQKGVKYDREYGRLYSVPGKSAASLLDAEEREELGSLTSAEASRKRIAAAQRERDLQKKLGEMGTGVGAEYMRTKTGASDPPTTGSDGSKPFFDKPKISDLGLLNNKATSTRLSPQKDRKHHFGLGAMSSAGREAIGWGGARKAGILQPKETRLGSPEKGQTKLRAMRPPAVRARSEDGSLSPTKKRARFALEKGIREPGRESGGAELDLNLRAEVDDDEDELDIV